MVDLSKWFKREKNSSLSMRYKISDYWALKNDVLGRELLRDVSNMFFGTAAAMNAKIVGNDGELRSLSMLNRMALTTAIYFGAVGDYREVMQPITPEVSENLLERGRFSTGSKEALALLLYDSNGSNKDEAEALFESIRENQEGLGLIDEDLSRRLVVVNAGLERERSMPNKVKPIVLPDFTEVYSHDVLDFSDSDYSFSHASDRGLPNPGDLRSKGKRILKMPGKDLDIGLRILVREGEDVLNASYGSLIQNEPDSRMYIGPR